MKLKLRENNWQESFSWSYHDAILIGQSAVAYSAGKLMEKSRVF